MPVIDLGKVVGDPGASMRFRGEWNGGAEYFNNASYVDTVTHHGSLWVCKQTNTGQEPIEGDYWGIGAQGNSDLNASDVTYDNESSGLSSNTAQGAIDEIVEIEKVINGNQADLYSPDETYTAGRLVINNNALWKAKQDIDVAEAWTPEHWELTTLAAELSALNSSLIIYEDYEFAGLSYAAGTPGSRGAQYRKDDVAKPGYEIISAFVVLMDDSSAAIPIVLMSTGILYLNLYRTSSSAMQNNRVAVRVTYRKS